MPDDLERDIQTTAADIAADADTLQAIETEKAELDPSDPRAIDLATQAERLARGIVSKTVAERELILEASDGPAPKPSSS